MDAYVQRIPTRTVLRRERRCLKCGQAFRAEGRYRESGRWSFVEHVCDECTAQNRKAVVGLRLESYPEGISIPKRDPNGRRKGVTA